MRIGLQGSGGGDHYGFSAASVEAGVNELIHLPCVSDGGLTLTTPGRSTPRCPPLGARTALGIWRRTPRLPTEQRRERSLVPNFCGHRCMMRVQVVRERTPLISVSRMCNARARVFIRNGGHIQHEGSRANYALSSRESHLSRGGGRDSPTRARLLLAGGFRAVLCPFLVSPFGQERPLELGAGEGWRERRG